MVEQVKLFYSGGVLSFAQIVERDSLCLSPLDVSVAVSCVSQKALILSIIVLLMIDNCSCSWLVGGVWSPDNWGDSSRY